ncbi:pyridoxamine 5'-phosphate oxidase family protein [Actinocorallia longicatena]|uniref:Pyridoxamine 5'-phosphate oxidase family protein n=1 Tax=Actinocorallia longicatena TaxID=111803 RepID=A0ABP6QEC2_9ACTN
MHIDAQGLEILDREECLRLLATVPLGRVVFTDKALPAIQPVIFGLDDDRIVLRTSPGAKLALATRGSVVAFEADSFDPGTRAGWSVTLIGEARPITDPAALARAARLAIDTWTPGPRDHYVEITGRIVSGRRIVGALCS